MPLAPRGSGVHAGSSCAAEGTRWWSGTSGCPVRAHPGGQWGAAGRPTLDVASRRYRPTRSPPGADAGTPRALPTRGERRPEPARDDGAMGRARHPLPDRLAWRHGRQSARGVTNGVAAHAGPGRPNLSREPLPSAVCSFTPAATARSAEVYADGRFAPPYAGPYGSCAVIALWTHCSLLRRPRPCAARPERDPSSHIPPAVIVRELLFLVRGHGTQSHDRELTRETPHGKRDGRHERAAGDAHVGVGPM